MSNRSVSGGGLRSAGTDPRTWAAFLLMVLFAGGNLVAIRVSNFRLPPFWGAAIRSGGAALVFWVIATVQRIALPRGRALRGAILYGILSIGASYALLYWGLVRLPAGLSAPIAALAPLLTVFFAAIHRLEPLHLRSVVGALVAATGVAVGLLGGIHGAVYIPSVLALIVSIACVAEAGVVVKLFPRSPPAITNAIAFTAGAPVLFALSRVAGEKWILPSATATWVAFAYLVLIGSVGVFLLWLFVLARWPASAASYAFLLIPVVTVVMAAFVLGEQVTITFAVGSVIALAGVWIGIQSSPKTAVVACPELAHKTVC